MKTQKNINTDLSINDLVGLWALIRNEHGKIKYRVFIYGKADHDHFLVQGVCALTGQPNVIRIVRLDDMLKWDFYSDGELLLDECGRESSHGSVLYALQIPKNGTE